MKITSKLVTALFLFVSLSAHSVDSQSTTKPKSQKQEQSERTTKDETNNKQKKTADTMNKTTNNTGKSENKTVSGSGEPIYTSTDENEELFEPQGEEHIEEISNHIEKHIGKIESVFHELASDIVHIDVHHVKPSKERPYHTLITSGMSDLAMTTPEGYDVNKHIELMISLPAEWKISQEAFENENWYCPIRQLKILARFPHRHETWLGPGHSIPNGDPAEPYAENTKFNGIVLANPTNVPEEFTTLKIGKEKEIVFLNLIPVYDEEMNLKLDHGARKLFEKLQEHDINDVLDIKRTNVARKKLFGLF